MISITDFSKITEPEVLSALMIFSTCNQSDFLLYETESEIAEEHSEPDVQMNTCPEKSMGFNCAFPQEEETFDFNRYADEQSYN